MTVPRKRVARADFWIDPAFDERFRREPDIAVEVVAMGDSPAAIHESLARAHVYHVHAAKDELLAESDVISLHCPRDPSTMKMIDARAFARMKPGAVFITTARGGIHDEGALERALASEHHTAGVSREARRNMAAIAAEQIVGARASRASWASTCNTRSRRSNR